MAHVYRRVRRGARFLDRNHPGWHNKVDTGRLDVFDSDRCVAAQLYGNYWKGIDALRIPETRVYRYGMQEAPDRVENVRGFNSAWRREIKLRRENCALPPQIISLTVCLHPSLLSIFWQKVCLWFRWRPAAA